MNFSNMKILVTGGAGFIGSVIVRELIDANANVIVYDNFSADGMGNLRGTKDYGPRENFPYIIPGLISPLSKINELKLGNISDDKDVFFELNAVEHYRRCQDHLSGEQGYCEHHEDC